MSSRIFETARTLIYDPVAANRNATRAALQSIGFRNVDPAAGLDILEDRLRERSPDLLLCEVVGAEADTCRIIQSVRQGLLGANPFIVIMVTTWRRDGTIIGQVLNSGADDLIARPFSATALGERIRILGERRKGFAITSDYIGPDRRRDPARGGSECLNVPNPLQLRAQDIYQDEEGERRMAEAIAQGNESLNREKMQRDAIQLGVQWRMLEQQGPGSKDFFDILSRMERMAEGIKRRAGATQFKSACEWCGSLSDSIRSIVAVAGKPESQGRPLNQESTRLLNLVGHAVQSLGQIFTPGNATAPRLIDLDGPQSGGSARTAAA
jgi:DNA-binding response OmpR family regulator